MRPGGHSFVYGPRTSPPHDWLRSHFFFRGCSGTDPYADSLAYLPTRPSLLNDAIELLNHFHFKPDAFRARHFHFGKPLHGRGIALGCSRTNDIIINTLVPFILLYSRVFSRHDTEHNAILLYRTLPPLQLNEVTQKIENQVLHRRFSLSTAGLHQGALQLHQLFCQINRCGECHIGRYIHGRTTERNQCRLR